MTEIDKIIISTLAGAFISSIPFLFYSVYRSRQIPAIWKKLDLLSKEKAEDNDMKGLDDRLRKVEIDFAEKMGRLAGLIENLEKLEKRMEKALNIRGDDAK